MVVDVKTLKFFSNEESLLQITQQTSPQLDNLINTNMVKFPILLIFTFMNVLPMCMSIINKKKVGLQVNKLHYDWLLKRHQGL
jgi:hypothetical protein